jgi:hypothetical protein
MIGCVSTWAGTAAASLVVLGRDGSLDANIMRQASGMMLAELGRAYIRLGTYLISLMSDSRRWRRLEEETLSKRMEVLGPLLWRRTEPLGKKKLESEIPKEDRDGESEEEAEG